MNAAFLASLGVPFRRSNILLLPVMGLITLTLSLYREPKNLMSTIFAAPGCYHPAYIHSICLLEISVTHRSIRYSGKRQVTGIIGEEIFLLYQKEQLVLLPGGV
jgi:hypothetical protein